MSETLTMGISEPYSYLGYNVDQGCYVFFYENYVTPGAGDFSYVKTDEGPAAYVTPGKDDEPDYFWVEVPAGWDIVGPESHISEDDGSTYTITACPQAMM